MCQEVLKIVLKMNQKHVETKLAIQCAPLITGIKISNLLIVSKAEAENLPNTLRGTGLVFLKLSEMKDKVTFLVFRRLELRTYLENFKVQEILLACGYEDLSFQGILRRFIEHYQAYAKDEEQFPHEMGLLLGYPVEDVEGFIVHNGQNFICSGYWKVYKDAPAKQELFRKYEEAQRDVIALLAQGIGIRRIIKGYSGGFQMKEAV
ncbi:MAG: DUF3793 family protein [Roseburia sp.]|nr:DUF3793 family protein [Roseburia sp.]